MSIVNVNPSDLPPPRGHYAHTAIARGLAWISGQLPTTGSEAPFREQAESVLERLDHCLRGVAAERRNLVSVRVFLAEPAHRAEFDELFARWCGEHTPARIVVPTPPLRDGLLVEIEAVATSGLTGHEPLGSLDTPAGAVQLHRAGAADIPALVRLLADDELGASRENTTALEPYLTAFAELDADPRQLLVAARHGQDLVGTLQLSIIPGLSRQAVRRAQIEGVRVSSTMRGHGLGTLLLRWALDEARRRGAGLAQLTSDLRRADAIRFYESLGMTHSHAGMKIDLRNA
ncbi:GNAT family N-acetyltransferase [Amycolatopsis jiangsuensis]|uniref:Enamine deaminase RidA (YjgF/YER057c/UK114 family)/ribosomal protein S18 acetylase RimI-like enzyme n=1 Tax=Amycolatopsis jiangsuensis TaxID=1181879 RepID=A0A840J4G4_9PSEU|nr:GNAT family N-acetyltransferase [Amycolatopsis jiangsuensis]MBB4688743.1 enamine deaminase RidA (YjgF/YER057c/UK114 family)/ribosomal protein S18 acetylase RimI-like enzyme [Amycolatopsis jiangsuensis]